MALPRSYSNGHHEWLIIIILSHHHHHHHGKLIQPANLVIDVALCLFLKKTLLFTVGKATCSSSPQTFDAVA